MRVLFYTCIVIVLAGCQSLPPLKAYEGEVKPDSEIARIVGAIEGDHTILQGLNVYHLISCVDGKSTSNQFTMGSRFPKEVIVEPGRHYIQVAYSQMNSYAFASLWVDAKANEIYSINSEIDGYKIRVWLTDRKGSLVGGIPDARNKELTPDQMCLGSY